MLVSIVVRSYNDISFIKETLDNIFEQKDVTFEVLNFDCASTDGTKEVIHSYEKVYSEDVDPNDYIPGAILNRSIQKSKGDIIVFNNSDCIPQNPFWLKSLIQPLLDHENCIATFGRQIARKNAWPFIKREYQRAFDKLATRPKENMFFSLATSAIKKEYILKYPFDEKIEYSEDVHWFSKVKEMGFDIQYAPKAIVEHSHNYTIGDVKKRFYNEGYAMAEISECNRRSKLYFLKSFIREFFRDFTFLLRTKEYGFVFHSLKYRYKQSRYFEMGINDFVLNRKNLYAR
jgi:rhamnosyltransferase